MQCALVNHGRRFYRINAFMAGGQDLHRANSPTAAGSHQLPLALHLLGGSGLTLQTGSLSLSRAAALSPSLSIPGFPRPSSGSCSFFWPQIWLQFNLFYYPIVLRKQHASWKYKPEAIKAFISGTFASLLTYIVLKVK